MRTTTMNKHIAITRLLSAAVMTLSLLLTSAAHAAVPGITGPSFDLSAEASYITQPDGQMIYSFGYGCRVAPAGFAPAAISGGFCNTMQIPGPTLIVHEGDAVTVKLTNNLPVQAGNTSILFPGFTVTATGGVNGGLVRKPLTAVRSATASWQQPRGLAPITAEAKPTFRSKWACTAPLLCSLPPHKAHPVVTHWRPICLTGSPTFAWHLLRMTFRRAAMTVSTFFSSPKWIRRSMTRLERLRTAPLRLASAVRSTWMRSPPSTIIPATS